MINDMIRYMHSILCFGNIIPTSKYCVRFWIRNKLSSRYDFLNASTIVITVVPDWLRPNIFSVFIWYTRKWMRANGRCIFAISMLCWIVRGRFIRSFVNNEGATHCDGSFIVGDLPLPLARAVRRKEEKYGKKARV